MYLDTCSFLHIRKLLIKFSDDIMNISNINKFKNYKLKKDINIYN